MVADTRAAGDIHDAPSDNQSGNRSAKTTELKGCCCAIDACPNLLANGGAERFQNKTAGVN